MSWLTRAPVGSPVVVSAKMFPTGVRLHDGRLRVYGSTNVATYDSANEGASWAPAPGPARQEWFPDDPSTYVVGVGGHGNEVVKVRRGRSGRLHAAIIKFQTYGTWANYPSFDGWALKYTPFYAYSDDESATWSYPEAVPYTGWGGVAVDVAELSNGEVAVTINDGGANLTPPYTLANTGEYPDARIAIRNAAGTSWSLISPPMASGAGDYYGGASGSYIWGEQSIDVIHDGSTYGLAVGYLQKLTSGVYRTNRYIVLSADGMRTWGTPVFQNDAVNRGTILVAPDGDVVVVYWDGFYPVMRVSRDQAATFGLPITLATRSANHGVEVFPIAGSGVSPNLGVTFGDGTDDAHGAGYYLAVSRGSDVIPPTAPLLVTPTAIWVQNAFQVTVTAAPRLVRSATAASVYSASGGVVRFTGASADRFMVSLDGITWATTVTVAAGTTAVHLGVVPQAGDESLTASVGVPL